MSSIFEGGLVCNARSAKLQHISIALPNIQELRSKVRVPNGLRLHEYVNLYLHARNPMLYVRNNMHQDLAVLRIRTDVLDITGAIVTDGNASSQYTAFYPSPAGLSFIDSEKVFAEYWNSYDQIQHWRNARMRCAELLIPYHLPSEFIFGAYTSGTEAAERILGIKSTCDVQVNPWFFFQ
ncbi:MAG: DUF4433 domain-containing protein [Chloroflexi bacterium]|nr:DUF4433 domain-containing protein [Chloroflexota bacterium]